MKTDGKIAVRFPLINHIRHSHNNKVSNLLKITAISHNVEKITDLIVDRIFAYLEDTTTFFHLSIEPDLLHRNSTQKIYLHFSCTTKKPDLSIGFSSFLSYYETTTVGMLYCPLSVYVLPFTVIDFVVTVILTSPLESALLLAPSHV